MANPLIRARRSPQLLDRLLLHFGHTLAEFTSTRGDRVDANCPTDLTARLHVLAVGFGSRDTRRDPLRRALQLADRTLLDRRHPLPRLARGLDQRVDQLLIELLDLLPARPQRPGLGLDPRHFRPHPLHRLLQLTDRRFLDIHHPLTGFARPFDETVDQLLHRSHARPHRLAVRSASAISTRTCSTASRNAPTDDSSTSTTR